MEFLRQYVGGNFDFLMLVAINLKNAILESPKKRQEVMHRFLLAVLQCVAVCCRVLQCFAVFCSVLQCVAVCYNVLQCVAIQEVMHHLRIYKLEHTGSHLNTLQYTATHCITL